MRPADKWFENWFSRDASTQNLIELFQDIQKEAYIQGYNDATKGDDPQYDDGLGS